ncbi:Hydrogenase maturation factor [Methanopyrus kandleri AV19]|uniref:Hydrogenase maturation factor n=2 Tax=Methanopyrus kandleri TaxID=2320 RepID=Q8TYR6_METKA|nr:Hydrogenase maturation factor [Methanopyrus kandleri AV19]
MKMTRREFVRKLVRRIHKEAETLDRDVTIMHVCGSHERTIVEHGLRSLLPENVRLVCGPGCPVCVTTTGELAAAIKAAEDGMVVCAFGDVYRVPTPVGSLSSCDGDVRVVQSVRKAEEIAESEDRDVLYLAVGFETTAPTTAAVLLDDPPSNFYVLSAHRLIPPAMEWLLESGECRLDAFICPGHVSTIIGTGPYESVARELPCVVAGFEPEDVLIAVLACLKMLRRGRVGVTNEYLRAVEDRGNPVAKELMERAFEPEDRPWRGFPTIPESALKLREDLADHDAIEIGIRPDYTLGHDESCICDRILRGLAEPRDCPLFGTKCTPTDPVGPCMVSEEGPCFIEYRFGGG